MVKQDKQNNSNKQMNATEWRRELLSIKEDFKKTEKRLAKYKKEDIPYFMRVNVEEIRERIKKLEKK